METAKSKGKRGIVGLAVGIIAVTMAIFLSSVVGHSLVSLNDHSSVLKGDTQTQFIYLHITKKFRTDKAICSQHIKKNSLL